MKRGIMIFLTLTVLGSLPLRAQRIGCSLWFSLAQDDPTPIRNIQVQHPQTITLHAWISANQLEWDWVGGFTFPIWFDGNYLEFVHSSRDTSVLSSYMISGVDCPISCLYGDDYPEQILWFAAVCLENCLQTDGTPYHIGEITFEVLKNPTGNTLVIDAIEYPPSNSPIIGDETGTRACYTPDWIPISISPPHAYEKILRW